MSEHNNRQGGIDGYNDAVCIDANRIYDSCSDKDCIKDIQVFFTDAQQVYVDNASVVKTRDIDVLNVSIDVSPIAFNKGFYSVDLTFFFSVKCDVYATPMCSPHSVCGLAIFNKKVILFGSEGGVSVFTSEDKQNCLSPTCLNGCAPKNPPKAVVQVVDPVILSSCLVENKDNCCCENVSVPSCVEETFGGCFNVVRPKKSVLLSIGLFSIVSLERQVQLLQPIYDFCVPTKECVSSTDDPCEAFSKISFPIDEFFPPKFKDDSCDCGCGHN